VSIPTSSELLERMHGAEHLASSFNKLDLEEIVTALEARVSRMRNSLSRIDREWPEFCEDVAAIRGFAFLCFSHCHELCLREIRRERVSLPPARTSRPPATLDSLA
jgi:hypothetical protein